MRALITGIDGFVGAHLADHLLRQGWKVFGLSSVEKPITTLTLLGREEDVTRFYGDIRDESLVRHILTRYGIKKVFHLAAQSIVSTAYKNPIETIDTNIIGTATVLNACRDTSVDKAIVSSTDKVYGDGLKKSEDAELVAGGIYETSKVCVDYLARSFRKTFGLPITVTRSCNIYGPFDMNSRIVPNTISALLRGGPPIIYTEATKTVRQYIYVRDVCSALEILATSNIPPKLDLGIYNISADDVVGQEEIVRTLIKISGLKIEPEYVQRSSDVPEIPRQSINCDRLKGIGWGPKYNLYDGLPETWRLSVASELLRELVRKR